ncbi:MAG: PAS-domain containing protein [Alphaproteobacteria bacterium]
MLSNITPISAFSAGLLLGAGLLLIVAWMFRRRAGEAEHERRRIEAVAVKAREILAGSPDGLFLWDRGSGGITCSRKLASLLSLADGTNAKFEDVIACFDGDSAKRLKASVTFLHEEGRRFEIVLTTADSGGRRMVQAVGARASAKDGKALADMVWMRDISAAAKLLIDLTGEGDLPEARDLHLRGLLDALPFPIWLRDGDLRVVFTNQAALNQRVAGPDDGQAETARDEARAVTRVQDLENAGETRSFDVTECPLATDGSGGDGEDASDSAVSGLIGYAFPHGSGDNPAPPAAAEPAALPPWAQMAQAVLKGLGTGIAIFDRNTKLAFFNEAYRDMWRLDAAWLDEGRDFPEILEHLRAERRLPEVPDFRAYKMEQLALFDEAGDPMGDLMHLPDGRTLRAVAYPMPSGGLAFGYDDVTDQLDLESANNARDAVYRASLENLGEAIAVFGSDGRLKFWNPAFARLWDLGDDGLSAGTHVSDFVEATRPLAATGGDWDTKKAHILSAMTRREVTRDAIECADGRVLEFVNTPLPDGGVLIAYAETRANGAPGS